MQGNRISSPQNPLVKRIAALRDRRERERSGLMLVEGYDEVSLALDCRARLVTLVYCPDLIRVPGQMNLVTRAGGLGAEIVEAGERAFTKMAYRENPDGWLATFPPRHISLSELRLEGRPFVLVAEGVEKPGNLGAMLRTADAAGVDAVIASDPLADWGNPNVVRASRGALFAVQVAADSNENVIAWLRERDMRIVAAIPEAPQRYDEADLRGPLAIVVGEEHHGLSAAWRDAASIAVRIPMFGKVNSLNVATAAALLVYEAVKQRLTVGSQPASPRS